jgi:hypothetical protein
LDGDPVDPLTGFIHSLLAEGDFHDYIKFAQEIAS